MRRLDGYRSFLGLGGRFAAHMGRLIAVALLAFLPATARTEPSLQTAQPPPASAEGTPDPGEAAADSRPVVRLAVKNAFNPEDKIFPQVVEGRLISDLGDMETFRMVGVGAPGDYVLTCTIRALDLESGMAYTVSPDAESNGTPQGRERVTVTMDLDLELADEVKKIHRGGLSVQASREFEISPHHTVSLLSQELIDRAAQRIEKMLRKKLPKR